jgi:hypothetical protein
VIQTSDYTDVSVKADQLGLRLEGDFVLLPRNFEETGPTGAFVHDRNEATVRKLLSEAGLKVQTLEKAEGEERVHVQEAAEWIAPIIYAAASYIKENPEAVKLAFDVLFEYLKANFGNRSVKMKIVTRETRKSKDTMITYEGPVEGVKDLPKVIREVVDK